MRAVLYFRYQNSPYLGQWMEEVQVLPSQSPQAALVQALIATSLPPDSGLASLFPKNTRVLSVVEEGRRLFVALSEEVNLPLSGESSSTGPDGQEAKLRRQLAMASLVNTLTESGTYSSVQVLVVSKTSANDSLRLSNRYYLKDDDSIPPPLSRQEHAIITPGKAAGLALESWKNQDWPEMRKHLIVDEELMADAQLSIPGSLPTLLEYEISPGINSPEGDYAICLINLKAMDLQADSHILDNFPLRMIKRGSMYHLAADSLIVLMEELQ